MPLQFVVIRLDDAKGTQGHRNFIRCMLMAEDERAALDQGAAFNLTF